MKGSRWLGNLIPEHKTKPEHGVAPRPLDSNYELRSVPL
jgi:hypothetical protein